MIENSPDSTIVESQVTANVTGDTIGTTAIINIKEAKVGEDANEELFPGIGLSKTKRPSAEMCFELSGLSFQVGLNNILLNGINLVYTLGNGVMNKTFSD